MNSARGTDERLKCCAGGLGLHKCGPREWCQHHSQCSDHANHAIVAFVMAFCDRSMVGAHGTVVNPVRIIDYF